MFRAGGLTPNIHQAQFGTLLPLLDTGATDIVLELEPNVSTAVTQGARVVYSMAAIYGDFALTGVTVSGRTIAERPDVVRRFVQALDAAERFAHEHPDEALAVAEKRFPSTDPKVAALALKRMLDAKSLPDGALITPAAWRKAVQLRVDAHQLPNVDSTMPYLDNSFVPTNH
jgi:NitT/TauT family transport system substrate-binding protein